MRVIAGECRSLKLKSVPGDDVRPTTDRIKETLFNIIASDVPGSEFADLFCGSGGIGIEALSRGAAASVFVDSSETSLKYTRMNLDSTRLNDRARVIRSDSAAAVAMFAAEGRRFNIVFMDPPYSKGLEKKVLEAMSVHDILAEDGLVIVEAKADTEFDYAGELGFVITRTKSYGSNKHVFLKKQPEEK